VYVATAIHALLATGEHAVTDRLTDSEYLTDRKGSIGRSILDENICKRVADEIS
jgi:hypothetical protein